MRHQPLPHLCLVEHDLCDVFVAKVCVKKLHRFILELVALLQIRMHLSLLEVERSIVVYLRRIQEIVAHLRQHLVKVAQPLGHILQRT